MSINGFADGKVALLAFIILVFAGNTTNDVPDTTSDMDKGTLLP